MCAPPPAAIALAVRPVPRIDGREVVAHLPRRVAVRGRAPEAERAEHAGPPAFDAAVLEDGAGVEAARGDRLRRVTGPEIDGGEVVAHLAGHVAVRVLVAEPEVADGVRPPAFDGGVVEQRAAPVARPCRERDRAPSGAEVDGREVRPHVAHVDPPVDHVAEPELAVVVVAPAFDAAVVKESAGRAVADRQTHDLTAGRAAAVGCLCVSVVAPLARIHDAVAAERPARAGDHRPAGARRAARATSSGRAGTSGGARCPGGAGHSGRADTSGDARRPGGAGRSGRASAARYSRGPTRRRPPGPLPTAALAARAALKPKADPQDRHDNHAPTRTRTTHERILRCLAAVRNSLASAKAPEADGSGRLARRSSAPSVSRRWR